MKLEKTATFAIYAKTVKDLKDAEPNLNEQIFGHLTSMLKFGMFLIQNGRIKTEYLQWKYLYNLFEIINLLHFNSLSFFIVPCSTIC